MNKTMFFIRILFVACCAMKGASSDHHDGDIHVRRLKKDKVPPVSCKTCPSGYYDGCNLCACDGGIPICTLRFCQPDEFGEATCNEEGQVDDEDYSDDKINCKTCPFGYFDGCNTCGCDEKGFALCTLRGCGPDELKEPSCNEVPPVSCETCPNGFFDGCNSCNCEEGFPICALRFCEPEEFGEAFCNEGDVVDPDDDINCKTCPGGYFDGCNTCGCDERGLAFCTEIACEPDALQQPSCNELSPVGCETCPNGFFDGCNSCGCEGGVPFCTLRFCEPEEFEEASCNEDPVDPVDEINCTTCPAGYFDGCNTCGCGEGGLAFCTLRACGPGEIQEPSCNEINCKTCPGGFFDGCNVCGCDGDTVALCTQRFCEAEEFVEATCNRVIENEISCQTCPSGTFFDGCNDCICGDDGTLAGCTKKFCDERSLEEPFCREPKCDESDDVSVELWNADLDVKIQDLGKQINLCRLGDVGLTLVANPPCKKKVTFRMLDTTNKKRVAKNVEKVSPFSLGDDRNGDLFPAPILKVPGSYVLAVNPRPGKKQAFAFDIVDDC